MPTSKNRLRLLARDRLHLDAGKTLLPVHQLRQGRSRGIPEGVHRELEAGLALSDHSVLDAFRPEAILKFLEVE